MVHWDKYVQALYSWLLATFCGLLCSSNTFVLGLGSVNLTTLKKQLLLNYLSNMRLQNISYLDEAVLLVVGALHHSDIHVICYFTNDCIRV